MTRKLLYNLFGYEREETPGEILFYRFFELVVVYGALAHVWQWARYLGRLRDIVLPLGIAEYVDVSFMYADGLGFINAGLVTIFVLMGFFRVWRYAYLVSLLLLHLQYVARFSQGKIAHGSNLVGMAVLALAVATLAYTHRREIRRTALGLCYFFFGLGYITAALSKLGGTGLHWPSGRHLWMWIQERTVDGFSTFGTLEHNWIQQLVLDHIWIGTLVLTVGLLTELCAFLLWFERYRPYIGTALIGMHLGIYVIMSIFFIVNIYLLLLLAYPWPRLIDTAVARLDAARADRIRRLSLRLT